MDDENDRAARAKKGSPFLNTAQAAFYIGLSQRTLEKMRLTGGGPKYRKHGRYVRYHIDELDDWSKGRPPEPGSDDDKGGSGSADEGARSCACSSSTGAEPAVISRSPQLQRWRPFVSEASARFHIPQAWICAVIEAESRGKTVLDGRPITSRAGAMYERFGFPGLFAAYNAGPERYEGHLKLRRPLPKETVAYLKQLEATGISAADMMVLFLFLFLLFSICRRSSPTKNAGRVDHPPENYRGQSG